MIPDHDLNALIAERVLGAESACIRTDVFKRVLVDDWIWNPLQNANHHGDAIGKLDSRLHADAATKALTTLKNNLPVCEEWTWLHLTEEGRRAFWHAWAEGNE